MKTIIGAASLIAMAAAVTGSASAQSASAPAPAAATVPADPARLAEARRIAAKLLPPGAYRTVMHSAMAPMIDGMGGSIKALPLRQMAEIGGLSAKDAAALDKVNIERVMAIYDPHWEERQQLTMRAMFDAMGDFFTTLEPELRDAYAHAFADRFSLAELRDLDGFFATPAGSKFATQYLTMATDPAVVAEMRSMMPKMMAQMPTFLAAAQKATLSLPPVRKIGDLTPTQKAELAKALGVPESQLKDAKSAT